MKLNEQWLREWINLPCSVEQLCHGLTMAGLEVEGCDSKDDPIIEINITPNRGDCLSIQGIARDVAAYSGQPYTRPFKVGQTPISDKNNSSISVKIEEDALDACPRYMGRSILNIRVDVPTPEWMQHRLNACGIKLHNCIVDVMNYVMLELGQPMHAFDLDKIDAGKPQKSIFIRKARKDENLLTLDEQTLTLNARHCVIAHSQNAIALAGIMGGLESAVSMQTQSVFLESAFFDPIAISGVARSFGIQSDSSFRFERGVDFNLPHLALERATQLILEIAGGEAGEIIEHTQSESLPKFASISLSHNRLNKLLGHSVELANIEKILRALECEFSSQKMGDDTLWLVSAPSHRFDLKIEEDLIEEVARIVGYDTMPAILPSIHLLSSTPSDDNTNTVPLKRFKRALVDMGYTEAITYSFVSPTVQGLLSAAPALSLANPISSELSVMRTSLWSGLIGALQYNQARKKSSVQLFESGLRFREHQNQWVQEPVLSGLIVGTPPMHWRNKAKAFDFYDLKGHIESLFSLTGFSPSDLEWHSCSDSALHPGQSAELRYKTQKLGVMGLIHPKIAQTLSLEGQVLVFELLLDIFSKKEGFSLEMPSKYPGMSRDLSFTLDKAQPVGEVVEFIKKEVTTLLNDVKVFDIYSGKGVEPERKSVAIALNFQHQTRTLVEDEIEERMKNLISALELKFNAQLRE